MKKSIKHFSFLAVLVAMFALVAVAVYAAGSDESAQSNNLDMSLVFSPETELTVYVDGAWDSTRSDTYGFGDNVSLTAPEVSGKTFSHWEADGSIISYSNPLKLTMNAHTTLYAVYASTEETTKPVSGFTSITRTNEGNKISFQAIAGGGTVEGAGIVYSTTASGETLKIGGTGVTDVAAVKSADLGNTLPDSVLDDNNCWMLQITPADDSTVYHARTYVTIGGATTYGDVKNVKLSDLESGISLVADPDGMHPDENGSDTDIASLLADVKMYTVTFDANGGAGTMAPQAVLGGKATALNTNTFTREGYTFSGWSTNQNGGGTTYTDGQSATFSADTTLYAQWKKSGGSGDTTPGGSFGTPGTSGKTTPAKPSAPTLESKTDTTITVKTIEGQEYSIDGGKTWQKSGTFTELKADTEYSIITKISATSTANESPSSDALVVKTESAAKPTETPTNSTEIPTTPGSTTNPTETPTKPTETPVVQKDKVTKTEKAAAKIGINAGFKVSQTGKKVIVKWGKVSKADKYVVYAAYCGSDKCTKIKTLSGNNTSMTFTKLSGSKLNLKKNIKVYVVAYRKVNGKETKLAKSITAHIIGSKNAKYTNVKKIKLSKSKYTLKAKQTVKIKAKVVLVDGKKKQISDSHAPEFRYASGNTKVATVDENGKITAVKKGTCYVYVYAKNGYAKKIKVTVR